MAGSAGIADHDIPQPLLHPLEDTDEVSSRAIGPEAGLTMRRGAFMIDRLPKVKKGRIVSAYVIARSGSRTKTATSSTGRCRSHGQTVRGPLPGPRRRYGGTGGRRLPDRVIIVEFPDYESALAWYSSEEYAPAKSQRIKSSEAELILAQGL